MSGFAAGPVLYIGAVTRVMDGACYSQVICIIAIVATKLPRSPSWSAFFFYFFTVTDHTLSEPIQKLFLLSFLFSLSGMVGKKKKEIGPWRYWSTFFSRASLCSHRPSSAQWSTFPSECSQAICLFLSSLSTVSYSLPLTLPPQYDGFVLPCTFRLCVG